MPFLFAAQGGTDEQERITVDSGVTGVFLPEPTNGYGVFSQEAKSREQVNWILTERWKKIMINENILIFFQKIISSEFSEFHPIHV